MKLACGCGGSITIDRDAPFKERDELTLKFYEEHTHCKEAAMTQARAVESIAKSLHDLFVLLEGKANEE